MSRQDIVGKVLGRRSATAQVERADGLIVLTVTELIGSRSIALTYMQAVALSDFLRAAATFPQVGQNLRLIHEQPREDAP